MFVYSRRYSILFKAIAMAVVCLFCANTVILANSDTLAPSVGNPRVYREMRDMMEETQATAFIALPAHSLYGPNVTRRLV